MRIIKEKNPQANIVAVDYDSSASKVNQQNRIKLMLANARLIAAGQNPPSKPDREQEQSAAQGEERNQSAKLPKGFAASRTEPEEEKLATV